MTRFPGKCCIHKIGKGDEALRLAPAILELAWIDTLAVRFKLLEIRWSNRIVPARAALFLPELPSARPALQELFRKNAEDKL
jgi:hypothetical protein